MSTDTSPLEEAEGETDADESAAPLLEVEGLKRYFEESEGTLDKLLGDVDRVRAVDGVDLTIREGETLAVVGESGCGKSTLGQTILKIHEPTEGRIQFKGEDITDLSEKEMRSYRQEMQMVFQDPLASLNPRQTVGDILKAPMEVHDIGADDEERAERAREILNRVGMKEGHLDRYPHQFSGGQQQRIGLARALTLEPDLLIADEPTSALDVSVQAQILELLDDLQEEFGLTMIFIAHDLSVVRQVADRVAVMYLGEIVETAPVVELFQDPQHPYTRSLLSAVPRIDPEARQDRVVLEGTVPSPTDPPSGCRFHTRCPVVIPPDDWPGDREAFGAGFTFRTRLLAGELDPESVRRRLESERETVDDEDVVEHVIDRELPADVETLPDEAETAVREAARSYVAGDEMAASETIQEAFPSPCVRQDPRMIETERDHVVACHRFDDEVRGEPTWPDSAAGEVRRDPQ